MLHKGKFADIMSGLAEMYKQNLSEFVLDMYYDILKDYEYPDIEKAVKKVLATHKYNTLPKPADILEYLEGSPDDKALMAWLQAKEAVVKGGYVATIEFADPVISHCIKELGGWQWFCGIPVDELPFVEKRFRDLYNMLKKREITTPVRLVGFVENKNSDMGYLDKIPQPVKIGHDKDIKQIGLTN